jgi:nucleoside-diphosphate-sugar epimerase
LIDAFAGAGGRRLVVAGTSAEYQWGGDLPLDERTTALAPTGLYGHCKNALRDIVESWAPLQEISWAWGRIFNIFGPAENAERLIPRVIDTLGRREPLAFDAGLGLRDFLHVADAGDAFAALLGSDVSGAVNIASGDPMSVKALVSLIARCMDAGRLVSFTAATTASADYPIVARIARLRGEVGWTAAAPIDERIAQTIDWWRTNAPRAQQA